MLLSLFFSAPTLAFVWLAALVIALTVHEFAHAAVGKWRGDDTAEHMGRLSLNPLAHIDPLGFLMLITLGFGWAKPVPFDPRQLASPLRDGLYIALAGPLANLIMAAVSGVAFRVLYGFGGAGLDTMLGAFLILSVLTNLLILFFNLIPIHPLDGSKVIDAMFVGTRYEWVAHWLSLNGPRIMLMAVLVSIITPFDPFFFVQGPAFASCHAILGSSCARLLGLYFGG
jgi:Zn-dependent protease